MKAAFGFVEPRPLVLGVFRSFHFGGELSQIASAHACRTSGLLESKLYRNCPILSDVVLKDNVRNVGLLSEVGGEATNRRAYTWAEPSDLPHPSSRNAMKTMCPLAGPANGGSIFPNVV